jgi:predicted  nucleic acid-binding Zn-ribbon protein
MDAETQAEKPTRYRCRKCGDIPEPESHLMMASCSCGNVSVDRGWYGSRVLWRSGKYADAVEEMTAEKN